MPNDTTQVQPTQAPMEQPEQEESEIETALLALGDAIQDLTMRVDALEGKKGGEMEEMQGEIVPEKE